MYSCLNEYRFLEDDRPRSFRTPLELWDEFGPQFTNRGYSTASPAPIENEEGTTFFTVAGIQAFGDVLFGDRSTETTPALVAQPSIRTSARDFVGQRDGITTSFVNLATIRTDADVNDFVSDLDVWLDALSALGLFVSDCSLITNTHIGEDWGTGQFNKYTLTLTYGGLELGEFGLLMDFPQESRPDLTVIDCGFSLERICWALNRTPSFSPIIGPIRGAMHHSLRYLDLVRTLTLMSAGEIKPSGEGTGYRFRQFVEDIVQRDPMGDCSELIRYYHEYWQQFAVLLEFGPTRRTIQHAIDRAYNGQFQELRNTPSLDADTETFFHEMLNHGVSIDKLQRTVTSTWGK